MHHMQWSSEWHSDLSTLSCSSWGKTQAGSLVSSTLISEADSNPGRTNYQKEISANFTIIQHPLFCLLKNLEFKKLLKSWYIEKMTLHLNKLFKYCAFRKVLESKTDLKAELQGCISQNNMMETSVLGIAMAKRAVHLFHMNTLLNSVFLILQ